MGYKFTELLDEDVLYMTMQTLPDLIFSFFGIIGVSAALMSFLIFTVWGIFQVVRFMKSILRA